MYFSSAKSIYASSSTIRILSGTLSINSVSASGAIIVPVGLFGFAKMISPSRSM